MLYAILFKYINKSQKNNATGEFRPHIFSINNVQCNLKSSKNTFNSIFEFVFSKISFQLVDIKSNLNVLFDNGKGNLNVKIREMNKHKYSY